MKNLVVGAGLTGAVIAERIATMLREDVVVVEKDSHIGGMHYDYVDKESGIVVQPLHTNFLHTNEKFIWDYLSKYTKFMPLTFRPAVEVQGFNISMPLCLDALDVFPEEFGNMLQNKLISKFGYNKQVTLAELHRNFDDDLKFLAEYFYQNVFKPYTIKLWGISENALPACEDTYFPFRISTDNRYYKEKYQSIPLNGWTDLINNILKSNKRIKVKLNTDFSEINPRKFDRIFYTGSIDEYFDYKFGELPYRSVKVDVREDYCTNGTDVGTYNYPDNFDFIRLNIYKNIQYNKIYTSNKEIVGFEYVENFELGKNERFYPINNSKSNEIYKKYTEEAKELSNVYFTGRLGEFKFYESDELVTRAFETVARLIDTQNADENEDFNTQTEVENNSNE